MMMDFVGLFDPNDEEVSDSSLDSLDEGSESALEEAIDDSLLDATSPSSLPPEVESGNVEYKLKLINPSDSRFEHLVTQMKWRLQEGGGEAIYEIGVKDCGDLEGLEDEELEESVETLRRMADKLGASIHVLREHETSTAEVQQQQQRRKSEMRRSGTVDASDSGGYCLSSSSLSTSASSPGPLSAECPRRKRALEVLVRKVPDDRHFIDLRLAVLGHADAGKSTLLGVLTNGELDNGAGRARLNLFRHLHEIQTGRTSCISHEILGFDDQGRVLNYRQRTPPPHVDPKHYRRVSASSTSDSYPHQPNHQPPKTNEEICSEASKVISLMDLAGHPKYTKTTLFGLTGYAPHFAMLVVSANSGGLVGTTREHLGYALALEVPIFFVVSKLDLCVGGRETVEATIKQLESILTSPGVKKVPYRVTSEDSALIAASSLSSQTVSPIFEVSSVSGVGINFLLKFLYALPPVPIDASSSNVKDKELQEEAEFQVDEIFHIPSLGSIVGGRLVKGVIRTGDSLLLGPSDPSGRFVRVQVQSLHRNRAPCRTVQAGQAATLALGKSYPKSILRKGSVLLETQRTVVDGRGGGGRGAATPPPPSDAVVVSAETVSPSSLSSSASRRNSYASPPHFFPAGGSPLRNAQLSAKRRRSRRRSNAGSTRVSTSSRSSFGDDDRLHELRREPASGSTSSMFPFEPTLEEVDALSPSSSSSAAAASAAALPRACVSFEAEIYVLFHPHGIGKNFQATVHIGNIRQTVVIEWIHATRVLKTGERAVVKFRFIKRPEYVTVGSRLIFREANSKGMGNVTKVIHLGEEEAQEKT